MICTPGGIDTDKYLVSGHLSLCIIGNRCDDDQRGQSAAETIENYHTNYHITNVYHTLGNLGTKTYM